MGKEKLKIGLTMTDDSVGFNTKGVTQMDNATEMEALQTALATLKSDLDTAVRNRLDKGWIADIRDHIRAVKADIAVLRRRERKPCNDLRNPAVREMYDLLGE